MKKLVSGAVALSLAGGVHLVGVEPSAFAAAQPRYAAAQRSGVADAAAQQDGSARNEAQAGSAQPGSAQPGSAQPRYAHTMYNPNVEENSSLWANPFARSTDPEQQVTLEITDISPRTLSAEDRTATFTLKVTNNRDQPLDNLALNLQSFPAMSTAMEVRRALLSNSGEFPESTAAVTLNALPPGQSRELTVSVAIDPSSATSADVSFSVPQLAPEGPHPIMFSLVGDTLQGGVDIVSVARTTLTVTPPEASNTPLTFLWPLSANTDIAAGGVGSAPDRAPLVLGSENLAKELAAGGRLRGLLDAYTRAVEGPEGQKIRSASCIALDPELVDTVHRMAAGYRVGEQNTLERSQPRRLRDSWGKIFGTDDGATVEGTGSEDAQRWLDDLKALVEQGCTVVLPYAGADVNTVAAAEVAAQSQPGASESGASGSHTEQGSAPNAAVDTNGNTNNGNTASAESLVELTLSRGAQVIEEILGIQPLDNVTVAAAGYVTEQAAHALAGKTVIVASNSVRVDEAAENPDDPNKPDAANSTTALDNSTRLTHIPTAAGPVTTLSFSDDISTQLRATGTRPEIAGFSNPELRYDMTVDSPVARMGDALAVLDREVASGQPVLAVPPLDWSIDEADATALLDSIATMMRTGRAKPTALEDLMDTTGIEKMAQGATTSPFTDPGQPAQDLIDRMGRAYANIRRLTGLMINDERIALTREVYTRPLLQDLLRATSGTRANNRQAWTATRSNATERVRTVDTTTDALRGTITLVPPGNVFTRSSTNSPILVVARNGLPLPVPVTMKYNNTGGEKLLLEVPGQQVIPAQGSVTLSVPTQPVDEDASSSTASNLSLWLDSASEQQISQPVSLTVQQAPGLSGRGIAVVLGLLVALGVGAKVLWSRRGPQRKGKRTSTLRKI